MMGYDGSQLFPQRFLVGGKQPALAASMSLPSCGTMWDSDHVVTSERSETPRTDYFQEFWGEGLGLTDLRAKGLENPVRH